MQGKTFTMELAGKTLTIETGKYCEQAGGSAFVRMGDAVVMVNATVAKQPRDGVDFLPLSIEFEEKMYSVGKIPGGYIKREGRPSEKAILCSRLIDRPSVLFPKGFYNDIQVIATVLSMDPRRPARDTGHDRLFRGSGHERSPLCRPYRRCGGRHGRRQVYHQSHPGGEA